MSRTYKDSERHIRVRGIRKDPPDLRRLARALIVLAEAQAEAEAQADHGRAGRPATSDAAGDVIRIDQTSRAAPKHPSDGDAA